MIGISKLYCGTVEPSDALRYGRQSGKLPSHLLQFSKDKRPVVVWNATRRCNLKCVHCRSSSELEVQGHPDFSLEEGFRIIDDIASFVEDVGVVDDEYTASVPSHGVVMLRVTGE